jgi:DNA-binding NarL/FixJ family response regulator
MALGWENTEIANELGLGTNTVKTFVSRILYRLRARNRTEAVANAYRQGLLPIDTEEKEN